MTTVYILQTYEYDSYSYSGYSMCEMFIHSTMGGALNHASQMGLTVVEFCGMNANNEATIHPEEVLE